MKIFFGVVCPAKKLSGADPDHDPNPGFLKWNFYHSMIWEVIRILLRLH